MPQYLFMCRSLTYAQRAEAALESAGINSNVIKAPQGLSTSGCGYAVSLRRRFLEAKNILSGKNLITGKIFVLGDNGEYQEVQR